MIDPNTVWQIGAEDGVMPDNAAQGHGYSFRAEDVQSLINVPMAEVGEFLALSTANDYGEIMRRWGVPPPSATSPSRWDGGD